MDEYVTRIGDVTIQRVLPKDVSLAKEKGREPLCDSNFKMDMSDDEDSEEIDPDSEVEGDLDSEDKIKEIEEKEEEEEEEEVEKETSAVSVMESEELLRDIKAEPIDPDTEEVPPVEGEDEEPMVHIKEEVLDNEIPEEEAGAVKRKALESDEEETLSKKKKDEHEKDMELDKRKACNLRRNIREVMDENQLDEATLAAQRQEMERLRRVQDQQKYLRETQRQIAINRANKTQTRVISLLQGNTTARSVSPSSSKPNTVLVKLSSSGGPPQVLNKKMLEAIRNRTQSTSPELKPNLCRVPNKPHMVTPSVSIAPVKPAIPSTFPPTPEESDETKEKKGVCDADIVTISSSSDEDDDCIVISEPSDVEDEEEDDPTNSGMHTNDLYNIPDEKGRVLINVGKPESEHEIFLAPQIARIIKPHQIGGVRFLFDNVVESLERFNNSTGFGCILAHSMGLGKTLQVVSFCDVFLRETPARTVMCIMPINTLQNWMAEFNMWIPMDPSSSPLAAHGEVRPRNFGIYVLNDLHKTIAARARVVQEWRREGGVLLIGYEMYRQLSLKRPGRMRKGKKRPPEEDVEDDKNKPLLEDVHCALVKPGPDLVICDEGHRIKNSHASISHALKQIRTKRRIVLTGYPLQNNLLEYWCMVDFVRPNYLGSKTEFSNMFERPIQNGQCIDSTPQDIRLMRYRAHVLHSLLEGFVQRRSHSVLRNSLPQKEEYVLLVRMTPFQRKLYNTFMNEVVRTKAVPNPLKAFAVCCKIWNHPDILYNFLKKREMDELQDLDLEEAAALSQGKPPDPNSPKGKAKPKGKALSKKAQAVTVPLKGPAVAAVQPNSSQPAEIKQEHPDPSKPFDGTQNYNFPPGQSNFPQEFPANSDFNNYNFQGQGNYQQYPPYPNSGLYPENYNFPPEYNYNYFPNYEGGQQPPQQQQQQYYNKSELENLQTFPKQEDFTKEHKDIKPQLKPQEEISKQPGGSVFPFQEFQNFDKGKDQTKEKESIKQATYAHGFSGGQVTYNYSNQQQPPPDQSFQQFPFIKTEKQEQKPPQEGSYQYWKSPETYEQFPFGDSKGFKEGEQQFKVEAPGGEQEERFSEIYPKMKNPYQQDTQNFKYPEYFDQKSSQSYDQQAPSNPSQNYDAYQQENPLSSTSLASSPRAQKPPDLKKPEMKAEKKSVGSQKSKGNQRQGNKLIPQNQTHHFQQSPSSNKKSEEYNPTQNKPFNVNDTYGPGFDNQNQINQFQGNSQQPQSNQSSNFNSNYNSQPQSNKFASQNTMSFPNQNPKSGNKSQFPVSSYNEQNQSQSNNQCQSSSYPVQANSSQPYPPLDQQKFLPNSSNQKHGSSQIQFPNQGQHFQNQPSPSHFTSQSPRRMSGPQPGPDSQFPSQSQQSFNQQSGVPQHSQSSPGRAPYPQSTSSGNQFSQSSNSELPPPLNQPHQSERQYSDHKSMVSGQPFNQQSSSQQFNQQQPSPFPQFPISENSFQQQNQFNRSDQQFHELNQGIGSHDSNQETPGPNQFPNQVPVRSDIMFSTTQQYPQTSSTSKLSSANPSSGTSFSHPSPSRQLSESMGSNTSSKYPGQQFQNKVGNSNASTACKQPPFSSSEVTLTPVFAQSSVGSYPQGKSSHQSYGGASTSTHQQKTSQLPSGHQFSTEKPSQNQFPNQTPDFNQGFNSSNSQFPPNQGALNQGNPVFPEQQSPSFTNQTQPGVPPFPGTSQMNTQYQGTEQFISMNQAGNSGQYQNSGTPHKARKQYPNKQQNQFAHPSGQQFPKPGQQDNNQYTETSQTQFSSSINSNNQCQNQQVGCSSGSVTSSSNTDPQYSLSSQTGIISQPYPPSSTTQTSQFSSSNSTSQFSVGEMSGTLGQFTQMQSNNNQFEPSGSGPQYPSNSQFPNHPPSQGQDFCSGGQFPGQDSNMFSSQSSGSNSFSQSQGGSTQFPNNPTNPQFVSTANSQPSNPQFSRDQLESEFFTNNTPRSNQFSDLPNQKNSNQFPGAQSNNDQFQCGSNQYSNNASSNAQFTGAQGVDQYSGSHSGQYPNNPPMSSNAQNNQFPPTPSSNHFVPNQPGSQYSNSPQGTQFTGNQVSRNQFSGNSSDANQFQNNQGNEFPNNSQFPGTLPPNDQYSSSGPNSQNNSASSSQYQSTVPSMGSYPSQSSNNSQFPPQMASNQFEQTTSASQFPTQSGSNQYQNNQNVGFHQPVSSPGNSSSFQGPTSVAGAFPNQGDSRAPFGGTPQSSLPYPSNERSPKGHQSCNQENSDPVGPGKQVSGSKFSGDSYELSPNVSNEPNRNYGTQFGNSPYNQRDPMYQSQQHFGNNQPHGFNSNHPQQSPKGLTENSGMGNQGQFPHQPSSDAHPPPFNTFGNPPGTPFQSSGSQTGAPYKGNNSQPTCQGGISEQMGQKGNIGPAEFAFRGNEGPSQYGPNNEGGKSSSGSQTDKIDSNETIISTQDKNKNKEEEDKLKKVAEGHKSGKEDPGIPYDWATELLKGYIPGDIHASAKMSVFFCILEESIALEDRILVFSQSLFTLNLMEELLQQQSVPGKEEKWCKNVNYFRLDGSTTAIEREKLINEFNSNANLHLFLVSTRAGSLGINLVGANRVIVFDASWNPCHDTQAVCRVYRYGQKKPCFVYRLVTDNCLEKKIYDRQINKQGMSDRVVDECNPDAHLSIKEVTSLCWDDKEDDSPRDFSNMQQNYIDIVTQKVLEKHSSLLSKEPFQHESLLVDRKDQKLSSAEKRLAKRSYELEKQANSGGTRPLYNQYPNQSNIGQQSNLQISRGDKPMASVRPMQSEIGSIAREGNRQRGWIPASVWQRQGMSAQEMTLPLDVVIPTNAPDRSSIVLKAGQKVMVLKSPKGIYMQLENGKIIAIRTSFKVGSGGGGGSGGGINPGVASMPKDKKANVSFQRIRSPEPPKKTIGEVSISPSRPRPSLPSNMKTSPGNMFNRGPGAGRPVRVVGPTNRMQQNIAATRPYSSRELTVTLSSSRQQGGVGRPINHPSSSPSPSPSSSLLLPGSSLRSLRAEPDSESDGEEGSLPRSHMRVPSHKSEIGVQSEDGSMMSKGPESPEKLLPPLPHPPLMSQPSYPPPPPRFPPPSYSGYEPNPFSAAAAGNVAPSFDSPARNYSAFHRPDPYPPPPPYPPYNHFLPPQYPPPP